MNHTLLLADEALVVADIGGTHIMLGHVVNSLPSEIRCVKSTQLRCANANLALAELLEHYVVSCGLKAGAVVLGIPGLLDKKNDTISHCNNIPELQGSGLRGYLEQRLGCTVMLEQDIMLQLLGEWHRGAARDSQAVFGVYFGTGIGTAYLQDGDPFRRGSSSLQAGHIPVSDRGRRCLCGNTDCVEAYASGHTLKQLAKQHGLDVSDVFITSNNPALTASIDEFIYYQSCLVATLITVTEPDMVLIGGGIPVMPGYPKQQFLDKTLSHLQQPYPADTIQICWAELDALAPLYGAIALLEINANKTSD